MGRRAAALNVPPAGSRRARRPAGSTLIWTVIAMMVLVGFCSFGVDWGRVQLVKTELRRTADAAARYAAHGLMTTGPAAARANAVAVGAENKADGNTPVVIDPAADVQLGTWDPATRTFAVAATESTATAVRVTVRRTAARGNAVPLLFAQILGRASSDVTVTAIARVKARRPGIVGLDSVTMRGSAGVGNVTDSFRSKAGALTGTTTTYGRGSIQSNGDISLTGNTRIYGDVRPGVGRTVSITGGASVTGSTSPLAKPLDYPAATAGTYATANDNANLPRPQFETDGDFISGSATSTVPAGNYYVKDLHVGASGTVNLTGPVTFYVTGSVRLDGTVNNGATPMNFRVVVCSTQDVLIGSSSTVYGDIYAPASLFTMGGSSTLAGSIVARAIDMGGSSRVIFDESLTVSSPGISLVQ